MDTSRTITLDKVCVQDMFKVLLLASLPVKYIFGREMQGAAFLEFHL